MSLAAPADAGAVLLPLARAAIAREFGIETDPDDSPRWLHEDGACFVALYREQRLRGCLGTLEAHRPLVADLQDNAVAVAFRDRRFRPLRRDELDQVVIEVTVLSPLEPIPAGTEEETLRRLRPGRDGVLLECHGHRGTYLPQVWRTLPDPAAFMASLRVKAGLPATFWDEDVRLHRYTATSWHEPEVRQS